MKSFNVNNKRLGVTLVVVGLVIILFGLQINFQGNIRELALKNSGLDEFKQYRVLNDKLIYGLPEVWSSENGEYKVSDILYHSSFSSSDMGLNGYIEVWSNEDALETFIDRSKDYTVKEYTYDKYTSNKVQLDSNEAYEVSYNMSSKDKSYNIYEYFVSLNNNVIKISFSVDKTKDKESNNLVFKSIVNTIKYKE